MSDLKSLQSVWDPLPDDCSNATRSMVYVERAKLVLDKLRARQPVGLPRPTRTQLARSIGCGLATLTQNRQLRRVVQEFDRLFAANQTSSGLELRLRELLGLPHPELPERKLSLTSTKSWLVLTDENYRVEGTPYPGIPIIVFADGIDEISAGYFRYLAVERGISASSVCTYADILRPYLTYCRNNGRSPLNANDSFLIEYREYLKKRLKMVGARAKDCIKQIFSFYVWCEVNGIS